MRFYIKYTESSAGRRNLPGFHTKHTEPFNVLQNSGEIHVKSIEPSDGQRNVPWYRSKYAKRFERPSKSGWFRMKFTKLYSDLRNS